MLIEGVVVEGRKLGRMLGFPTANVTLSEGLQLERGVYLSRVVVEGVAYDAVTNIGVNPTVGEVALRSESCLLDFDGDLYGKIISINLGDKLRDEARFESVDELRQQIEKDIEYARRYFIKTR